MNKCIVCGKNNYYIFNYGNYYFMLNIDDLEFYKLNEEEYTELVSNTARGIDLLNGIGSNEIQENLESNKEKKVTVPKVPEISSIVMEIANDCNLRCKYCYGEGGTYGKKAALMDIGTAKKCIDFLIYHGNKSQPLGVVFFGGEPLMNFKVVEEVIDYCNEKAKENEGLSFSFGMTTNALLLDSYKINYLKENKVMITVSIDGPKEYHNINRIFANGQGSYEIAEKKIIELLKVYRRVRARATISKTNLALLDIEKHLEKMGFEDIVLSLVDVSENSELYIPEEMFERLYLEIEKLGEKCIDDLLKKGKTAIDMFTPVLYSLYSKQAHKKICGAGTTYFGFNVLGEMYPCHRFFNYEKYKMGTNMSKEYDNSIFLEACFRKNKINCKECSIKNLCGGGCLHTSEIFEGNLMAAGTHYCSVYKKIIETSIYIYYKVKENNKDIFDNMFREKERQIRG